MTEMQELQALYFDMADDRVPVAEVADMLGVRVGEVCQLLDPVHVMAGCDRCGAFVWVAVTSRQAMRSLQGGNRRWGRRVTRCEECSTPLEWRRFTVPALYRPKQQHVDLAKRLGVALGAAIEAVDDLSHKARNVDEALMGTIRFLHGEAEAERQQRLRTMPYREYLRTPEWAERRKVALREAGYRCQVCNAAGRLDVHHRTYERRGEEEPGDLTVLCRPCHALHHRVSA